VDIEAVACVHNLQYKFSTSWDRISHGIIDKAIDQWQTWLCACVNAKGHHFEHLLWSSHTTGSFPSHLHAKSVLFFRTSHTIERRQHKFYLGKFNMCNVR